MSHSRPDQKDVVVIAEHQESVTGELCPIVGDDGVWYPEPVDDISEEQYRLLRFDLSDRSSLDPLGELVNSYQQVGVAPGAFCRGPTMSSPHTANDHVMGIVWRA